MPPKGKEKPKTKKELKAEQEAAARAAEEERLRQEEEARRLAEQVEQRRQDLLADYTRQRDDRLAAERQELVPLLLHMQQQRAAMAASQGAASDWESYVACSPLPDPRDRPAMNDFLNSILLEVDTTDIQRSLQGSEACAQLVEQCLKLAAAHNMEASLKEAWSTLVTGAAAAPGAHDECRTAGSPSSSTTEPDPQQDAACDSEAAPVMEPVAAAAATTEAAATTTAATEPPGVTWDAAACAAACDNCRVLASKHQQDAAALVQCIKSMVDAATAHVLHRADEYADPKDDVLLTAQQGGLQWGLWVNTQKNPRFKLVDLTGLGMTVEIPKQLALANIAIRVQRLPSHTCSSSSSSSTSQSATDAPARSCLVPLGGVLQAELLTLPSPPKHGRGWTIRQVTPSSSSISTVPYPIPPVGADPSTWRPEEERPPLTFSIKLPERLLVPAEVRVGWWDASSQAWSEEGISNVSHDAAAGRLSFSTTHLGCLALLQDSSAHLPYTSWTIRPSGGLGGSTAFIDLQVPGLPGKGENTGSSDSSSSSHGRLSLEVGSGWAKLCGPSLPQLAHLLGRAMPPWELLIACEACGLRLIPSSREAAALGLQGKGPAAQQAMCAELAVLCTKYLVASSRWNRASGQDVVLVRLSEVTDWEEGGRTSTQAAARIFDKEAAEGPRQVLTARREGAIGISWTKAANASPTPPPVPDFSTIEAVQAASQDESSWMHASLLHLLAKRQQAPGHNSSIQDSLRSSLEVDAGFAGSMVQMLQALQVFAFG